jgi:uncharacterized protein (DUF2062 family)
MHVSTSARDPVAPSRTSRLLETLLQLHDTPERTAAAFAVGVFFSFSALIGLQILLSMAVAFLFRLNRVAVFVGLNANLPWFIVPWYGGTTLLAATLLGLGSPAAMQQEVEALLASGWSPATFADRAADLLTTALLPLVVGSTIGAAVVAVAAYPVARLLLARRALKPR